MGFYIRKALKVGPIRFNLSKSGVGVSAGLKGLRLGTGPRGNYVHMGRGGLYFRKSLNSPSQSQSIQPLSEQDYPPAPTPKSVDQLEEISSGPVLEMVDSSSSDLLDELNEKRKKTRLLPITIVGGILLCIVLLAVAPVWTAIIAFVVSVIACWLASTKDTLRKTTVVFYNLEPDVETAYQQLHDAIGQIRSCVRTWHISARGDVIDSKYHGGAGALVKRQPVVMQIGEPPALKTNLEVPLIPVGREILALLPDRILVFAPEGVGAVSYEALGFEVAETKFIEEEALPGDATVIGTTWRYVNKKGGPDRRFKDNREIPICLYEQLHFWSATGLNEIIQISRQGVATPLQVALSSMGKLRTGEVRNLQV